MPATGRSALIIGGGIAGIALSRALAQVGIESRIFERHEEQSNLQVGSGLSIWNNAMRVLGRLELDDAVREIGSPVDVVEHRTWTGEVLATWPVRELGELLGIPTLCVVRAELHEALTKQIPEGIIELGRNCSGFRDEGGSVVAEFTDGSEERADFLVGADGLHSRVRKQLLGVSDPRYAGYVVYQGLTPFEHELAPHGLFQLGWGRGLRFNFERVGADNRIYWSAVVRAPSEERGDPARRRDELIELYRDWPEPMAAMIASTSHDVITRLPIHGRKPVSEWGKGNVTLAGDAAHPMTFNLGQGAGLGLEDAVVLAGCLREEPDVPTALRAYEEIRKKRTATMMRLSWAIGAAGKWSNPGAVRLRNQIMRKGYRGPAWQRHALDMCIEPGSTAEAERLKDQLPPAR